MPFKPGHGGGRPRGATHPKKYARDIIEKVCLGRTIPEELMSLRKKMDDQYKVQILLALMPYCYPKLSAVAVQLDEKEEQGDNHIETLKRIVEREVIEQVQCKISQPILVQSQDLSQPQSDMESSEEPLAASSKT